MRLILTTIILTMLAQPAFANANIKTLICTVVIDTVEDLKYFNEYGNPELRNAVKETHLYLLIDESAGTLKWGDTLEMIQNVELRHESAHDQDKWQNFAAQTLASDAIERLYVDPIHYKHIIYRSIKRLPGIINRITTTLDRIDGSWLSEASNFRLTDSGWKLTQTVAHRVCKCRSMSEAKTIF